MAVTCLTAGRGGGGGGAGRRGERAANQPTAEQDQGVIVPSCGCCAPWGQRCPSSKSGDSLVSLGMRDPLTATGRVCTSPEHISHTQPVAVVPSIHFLQYIHF